MASLTVFRAPEISATKLESLNNFQTKRGFRVFSQGSKSVETATNHRGSPSYQLKNPSESHGVDSSNSILELHAIHGGIKPKETPFKTEAISRIKIPAGAVLAPRGFFLKRKQSPADLLDFKSTDIKSPSCHVGPKISSNQLPRPSTISETNSSLFSTTPVSSPPKCQIPGGFKSAFTVKHSLSPQRPGVNKRVFPVPKASSAEDCLENSKPVSDESVSTTRTHIGTSCKIYDQASDPKQLKDLLMSPDWQNKTLNMDQLKVLTSSHQARRRKFSPCLKNPYKRSVQPVTRSADTLTDLTSSFPVFEKKINASKRPHAKTVSFSTNVLVYFY